MRTVLYIIIFAFAANVSLNAQQVFDNEYFNEIARLKQGYITALLKSANSGFVLSKQSINNLNLNIHTETDSMVQTFYFDHAFKDYYSGSFKTDFGTYISYKTDFGTSVHGAFYYNENNLPDSVVMELSGRCVCEGGFSQQPGDRSRRYIDVSKYEYDAENNILSISNKSNYFWYANGHVTLGNDGCFMRYSSHDDAFSMSGNTIYTYNDNGYLVNFGTVQSKYIIDSVNNILYRRDSVQARRRSYDTYINKIEFTNTGNILKWDCEIYQGDKANVYPVFSESYNYYNSDNRNFVRTLDVFIPVINEWYTLRLDSSKYVAESNCIERIYYTIHPETLDWYCISDTKQYLKGGVKKLAFSNNDINFGIYPNPCNNCNISILLPDNIEVNNITFFNSYGIAVLKLTEEYNEIPVNYLPNGIYTVVLTDVAGGRQSTKLLINK